MVEAPPLSHKNKMFFFYNRGISLIGIIISLMVAGVISGGLYYYLSKESPKATEKNVVEQTFLPEDVPEEDVSFGEDSENEDLKKETAEVNQKYTSSQGIILVKKDSNVEKIANDIAQEKKWLYIATESSDPQKIRNKIRETVKEYPSIEYLLIVGPDEQVPLKDKWGYVKYEASAVYGFGQGAVLDSLFYGNTDEDMFVELGVGRIPFDNELDVNNYFEDIIVKKQNNYFSNYPIYEEVQETEKSYPICLSKEFSNIVASNEPKKEDLLGFLNDALIFQIETHGSASSWSLKNDIFQKNDIPNLYEARPLVLANTCLSAQELGPEFIKKGAGAFIGANFVSGDFGVNKTLFFSKKIFSGASLGSSLKEYINYGIALATVQKEFEYSTASKPTAVLDVNNSVIADHVIILLGDPSIAVGAIESSFEKINLKKKDNNLLIKIPKPVTEILDDTYVFHCYGGANETMKNIKLKEHWDKLMNHTINPKQIISSFVFPVEGVKTISSAKEIINGKEYGFEIVRFPSVSLVRGDKEQFIVIEETIMADASVFNHPREIIIDFQ